MKKLALIYVWFVLLGKAYFVLLERDASIFHLAEETMFGDIELHHGENAITFEVCPSPFATTWEWMDNVPAR